MIYRRNKGVDQPKKESKDTNGNKTYQRLKKTYIKLKMNLLINS